jgi:TonB-linked SusC/RagA family outer membrane protein
MGTIKINAKNTLIKKISYLSLAFFKLLNQKIYFMKKLTLLYVFLGIISMSSLLAQNTQVTGKVTDKEVGGPLPGVTVFVVGTTTGTATNASGEYSINVPADATLLFSSIGMKTQQVIVGGRTIIDIVMEMEIGEIDEIVVTALGISREKKSLGYSVQEVTGDQVNVVKTDNFVNSLSGKISGVSVKRTTNIGGSTNILIRGSSSLTGDNQALFIVDGVPISNAITNNESQVQAGTGFDYGNAASDINPDDIESVSVLKGAAASALYGARAANGVIMITTKKGASKQKGIGITVNSGMTVGSIDKSTFPTYQTQYGGGYGAYYDDPTGFFWYQDIDGDGAEDLVVPLTEDASYGAAFDPNLMVYQWDAFDVESPNYMKKTPYVNAKNGPITFFETPVTYANSVAVDNTFDKGNYRLSYSNLNQKGIMPNSELKKNNFSGNVSYDLSKKLTATASGNYIGTSTIGRNSTGYNDNILGSMRQWMQTNVDYQQQKDAYFSTRRNTTWNYAGIDNLSPIYWDNPYWTRYENYESDSRNRFIGNMTLDYKLTDWLSIFGRVSTDTYGGLQEERRNVGSIANRFGIGQGSSDGSIGRTEQQSGYQRKDITYRENNYDLMLNINKNITDQISFRGVLGSNTRRTNSSWLLSATNGGIGIPRLFSLQNSVDAIPYPKESEEKIGVNGLYASASFGFGKLVFLDATVRRDHSSTLPADNATFYYPSISASMVFSELIEAEWLSFGKVRLSYAQVGNSAGFDQINDTYNVYTPLNGAITSVAGTKKNPLLKPETTNSLEGGLELNFFQRRIGFDLSLYKTNTIDQILPVRVTSSTGFNYKVINSGEIQNQGVELSLTGSPVRMNNFSWDITINYSKNVNEVLSLTEGLENLQLGSFQGGVTVNAMIGQPYGVIYGTDYTYLNGQRVVNATSGEYVKTSTSDNVIGNVNPDFNAGILNTLRYKNLALSFLIDAQKGGDIFSLDMYYGLATGLYEETVFTNELGNPVRNSLADGGGFINSGVNPDGSANDTRIRADRYGAFGYRRGLPDRAFVYDASYIKLRELAITYDLPSSILGKSFIKGVSISFIGSNLWILFKNMPYADPESGLGAGNTQGFSTGSLPSTRDFGFNLKLQF